MLRFCPLFAHLKGEGQQEGEGKEEGEGGREKHLGERTLRDIVSKNQAILGLGESDGVKIAFSFDILSIKDEWMKYFCQVQILACI